MADTGKQSPLGVNVLGGLLQGHSGTNKVFNINPVAESYMGVSKNNADYTPGKIVNDTCLKWLTYALKEAWARTPMNGVSSQILPETYDAMLNIGQSRITALGNSKPPTYQGDDPSNKWGPLYPANTGFAITGNVDHGQDASWDPWDSGDPAGTNVNSEVTKWGWVRAMALQAYNEFYWNAPVGTDPNYDPDPNNSNISFNPSYKDFVSSFLVADSFINQTNKGIYATHNSQTFLQGTYSNQNDLISADIAGVSLSATAFGEDLINLGLSLDYEYINKFGMPSNVLKTLQKNKALTQSVILALLSSGLSQTEINDISSGNITPTKIQEQKIYGALLVIVDNDLITVLNILNCKTKKLTSLADLLSVKKLFPISYRTLTVPIYNTAPGPTNAKTYYLLFINDELNPQLVSPRIKETVKTIIPPQPPPVVVPTPVVPTPVVIPTPAVVPTPVVITPPPPTPSIPAPAPVVPAVKSGGGCPAPWIKISLLDGKTIEAKDIKKDMYVYTQHETTKLWGAYPVSYVDFYEDDRWIVKFDGGKEFVGTFNHRVLVNVDNIDTWIEIRNLKQGDKIIKPEGHDIVESAEYYDYGPVVKITVHDAHTYLTEGFISHNVKKILKPDGEFRDFRSHE